MESSRDPDLNQNSNEETKKIFVQSRKLIQQYFQPTQSPKTKPINKASVLRLVIEEFYKTQREFSASMRLLVETIAMHHQSTDQGIWVGVEDMLRPYRILAENPFHEHPSGNDQADILHILQVITARNEKFSAALRALSVGISKTSFTHEVLDVFRNNPELEQKIKEQMNCESWLIVQGHADKPMQNLTRMQLLLKEIQRRLESGDCERADKMIVDLTNAVAELAPQVQRINEGIDSLILLNRIEHVLMRIEAMEIVQTHLPAAVDEKGREQAGVFSFPLKQQIAFTVDCIRQGVRMILAGNQDEFILYQHLLNFLKDIEGALNIACEKNKTYYSATTNYLYSSASSFYYTFFGGNDSESSVRIKDPIIELSSIVQELDLLVERFKILERIPEITQKAIEAYKQTL